MLKLQKLIITDLSIKGSGENILSPVRTIIEIYSKDGLLLATNDSQGNYSIENLIDFAKFYSTNKTMDIEDAFKKWLSIYLGSQC